MAPQRRGVIPPAIAARITHARQREDQAAADLDVAVVEALLAGGSVREVQALTGWSSDRVQKVGHAGGWPSAEMKAAREATRARNAEWRAYMGQFPDGPPDDKP